MQDLKNLLKVNLTYEQIQSYVLNVPLPAAGRATNEGYDFGLRYCRCSTIPRSVPTRCRFSYKMLTVAPKFRNRVICSITSRSLYHDFLTYGDVSTGLFNFIGI